jgi:hypothetical protein
VADSHRIRASVQFAEQGIDYDIDFGRGRSALDLAKASKVGVATIRRVEVVDGEIPVTLVNEAALRQALEAAGVVFIDENGGGAGVRLRKPTKEKSRK